MQVYSLSACIYTSTLQSVLYSRNIYEAHLTVTTLTNYKNNSENSSYYCIQLLLTLCFGHYFSLSPLVFLLSLSNLTHIPFHFPCFFPPSFKIKLSLSAFSRSTITLFILCLLLPLCLVFSIRYLLRLSVVLTFKPYEDSFSSLSKSLCVLLCACDLFERALHVDALVPGCRGVGQAVSGVAPAGDIHLLPAEVPEGFCHHHHAIICQCRRVLEK